MVLKKNLAFTVIVGLLIVAFVVALVWLGRQTSARGKVEKDVKSTRERLEELRQRYPTKEHLAQIVDIQVRRLEHLLASQKLSLKMTPAANAANLPRRVPRVCRTRR